MRGKILLAAMLALDVAVIGLGPRADQPTGFQTLRSRRRPPPPPSAWTMTSFHLGRFAGALGVADLGQCAGVHSVTQFTTCSERVGAAIVSVVLAPARTVMSLSWSQRFSDSAAAVAARDSLAATLAPGHVPEPCVRETASPFLRGLHWLTVSGIAVRFELWYSAPDYQLVMHAEHLVRWPPDARCPPSGPLPHDEPGFPRPQDPDRTACPASDGFKFYPAQARN